jgi:hypothetical protein
MSDDPRKLNEKKQILQTIKSALADDVSIREGDDDQNTLIFKFKGERIGLNQLDLIQLFTVIRYIHFGQQTVYTTIKQGFVAIAKETFL